MYNVASLTLLGKSPYICSMLVLKTFAESPSVIGVPGSPSFIMSKSQTSSHHHGKPSASFSLEDDEEEEEEEDVVTSSSSRTWRRVMGRLMGDLWVFGAAAAGAAALG